MSRGVKSVSQNPLSDFITILFLLNFDNSLIARKMPDASPPIIILEKHALRPVRHTTQGDAPCLTSGATSQAALYGKSGFAWNFLVPGNPVFEKLQCFPGSFRVVKGHVTVSNITQHLNLLGKSSQKSFIGKNGTCMVVGGS